MKLNINDVLVGGRTTQVLHYSKIVLKSANFDLPFVLPIKLLWQMTEACLRDDGIGLAAPQIGTYKRVFIIRDFNEDGKIEDTFSPYFNPVWTAVKEDGKSMGVEGCLSVPGVSLNVERWNTIEAEWWDWDDLGGAPLKRTERLVGLKARVFQHEWDHLQAKSIVDRGTPI